MVGAWWVGVPLHALGLRIVDLRGTQGDRVSRMVSWDTFATEDPELAKFGKDLLFQARIGHAFLATLRKDGSPRLHPISLIISDGHLYVLIPRRSPKCADLLRDGRYALQAFPPPRGENEEFYVAGRAEWILDPTSRRAVIEGARITATEDEILFELMLDRAMYTCLEKPGTPEERPFHRKWRASRQS